MNNSEDLSLKLLERSVEQYENARDNFFRDLKVAGVVLLVFQFLVFFKFVGLSDEKMAAQTELNAAGANQRALAEVQTEFGSIKGVLKTATDGLTNSLSQVPSDIRANLTTLSEELAAFRGRPYEPAPARTANDFSVRQEANMPAFISNVARSRSSEHSSGTMERVYLAGFTESEKKTLHDARTEGGDYQDLVVRIVETSIIQPEFQHLNATKEKLLARPLADGMASLRNLGNQLATLRKNGADVDSWLTNVERVVTLAGALQFSPPAVARWWSTRESKADYASAAQLDTLQIADQANSALSGPERDLKSLSQKMETAVAGLEQEGGRIEAGLLKLQTNASSIEALMQSYAKPLAMVALEPKDLVLYYPVILAAMVAMFACRQMLLRRRAEALAGAYRQLGLSKDILDVCFTDLPEPTPSEPALNPAARTPRRFMGLLWVVAVGFAVTSFVWVLTSKSLHDQAPRLLYLASALVMVATCLPLLHFSPHPKRPTQSTT